jgi:hypothetical protein
MSEGRARRNLAPIGLPSLPMVENGVIITAATLTILIAEWVRKRRRALPFYGWLGIVALASAEWLMFRGYAPVAAYFSPIAWTAYILIVDAAVFAVGGHGRSRLQDAPLVFARMALLSIPLGAIFELYNLRLHNWIYLGLPKFWPLGMLGYGWSLATITPAVFETAELIRVLFPARPSPVRRISRRGENAVMAVGVVFVVLPLILPQRVGTYLFALVWVGAVMALDPLNRRAGLPSFIEDFSEGIRGRLYSFLLAGWVYGWLGEFWNYWAGTKWEYTVSVFQNFKIFAMPAPGYLVLLPFAVECYCAYVFAAGALGWLNRVR